MDDLRKNDELTVRMQRAFRRKLDRAARLVSQQRRRLIKAGPLLVELAEPALDRILAAEATEAA